MKTSHIVVAALAFIFIVSCLYCWCNSYKVKVKYYYSPGCPHCRNFMGAWDKFASKGGAKFEKINCAENPDKCAGIRGVPHVVFESDKGQVVYPGDRTESALSEFLVRFSSQ